MANSQDKAASQHPDLLAAVLLHTLVSEGRNGMDVTSMAISCSRDPGDPADIEEIEVALGVLLDDELARCEGHLYLPSRAAIRAAELSF